MLLGFKKQFTGPILDGTKIFTIREKRKIEPKIGEKLHMYSGLRTKHTELISKEHTLTGIQTVNMLVSKSINRLKVVIYVDDSCLTETQLKMFIQSDGFENIEEFSDFWLEGIFYNKYGYRSIVKNNFVMYHWTGFRF
ncbi:hypothetical protein [Cyclobacterium marinum]|uniref:ASCH domain-containing protein n=1 Tax=Cyclobacterium marinum (strain ATCC 25205 / DSM 745 / LMG 13164 / NCIMB 1802) TaxID=880070 RepID=G0IY08_CYCMS|nr:hypothetical protein [Cyclobacterium marinum]AEL24341.1 hypothetical protein Cycma_0566 [Cyclobacterium marinum DSM 745]